MHSTQDDPSWSESYYFNFVDPNTKVAMFTRMGFRPGNGWADALHVIYLNKRRVAFTYGRRDIESDLSLYDGDLRAGNLEISCLDPQRLWQLDYHGPAQDIADAEVLLERSKLRPAGWFKPANLNMSLTFECLTEPHYAAKGERGHFEQSGIVTGHIALDDETHNVRGYGVRDKSWGPRDWGAGNRNNNENKSSPASGPNPFVNWFSMNFGEHAALGGSCFRHKDGVIRGNGWLQRDGLSFELEDVVIETTYKPDSIIHESIALKAKTPAGEVIEIAGNVMSVCPTKIPMPGGATFVNEGLAEFKWGDRIGYGIAEHWHAVSL